MNTFEKLEPAAVWKYFNLITSIPRPSKHESRIIRYLVEFGLSLGLHVKRDYVGNLVILKKATKGFENRKKVILQAHVDMVCEKNSNVDHDFLEDRIESYIESEWVKARGTTLGADDGIGMAAMMAILADSKIEHGPIECLFTVDEETGLTGAFELRPKFISGNILLNLDSEDEGEVFIGCAGGMDTTAFLKYKMLKISVPEKSKAFLIGVTGLQGGHSGDDIHKNRGNSLKILSSILKDASQLFAISLNQLEGGNLKNAIPREAFASILIPADSHLEFISWFNTQITRYQDLYKSNEPNLNLNIEEIQVPSEIVDPTTQSNLLNILDECPHGVIAWSKDMPDLVETSTNLASVKFLTKQKIQISTSQRSSVDSEKKAIAAKVFQVFKKYDCSIEQGNGYPGWKPDMDSEILKITSESYQNLFSTMPKIKAIHAGLECGIFLEKYPNLDMVSFGPTIKGAHSPDERLHIPSVSKFWNLLLEILRNIPEK